VEDASPHFLESDLLRELRDRGRLAAPWPELLCYLREALRLTPQILREALHVIQQGRSESLARYAVRFELLRSESGLSPEEAKRALMSWMTGAGRRELSRRLDQAGAFDWRLPMSVAVDKVPYEVCLRHMRREDMLDAYASFYDVRTGDARGA
jgi:hypothetical protein